MKYTADHMCSHVQQRQLGRFLLATIPATSVARDPREWVPETTYSCDGGRLKVYVTHGEDKRALYCRVRATTDDLRLFRAFGEAFDRATS